MTIQYHAVGFATQLVLSACAAGLHLLHGTGRGMHVQLAPGWISVWMPLAGALSLESHDSAWPLSARRLQVCRDGSLRVTAPVASWWIAVCGPAASWMPHLSATRKECFRDLFPGEFACSGELRRLLVRLARLARASPHPNTDALLDALCGSLIDSQHDLQRRLLRCSGRTQRRRQQTLMRLLRVRQHIEHDDDGRLDLARLARIASYSPCHLIRMHRDVFDETPSEYAARLRFARAWRLVRDTRMPVCEITEALGFESQSAFCRAFKNTYGVTTTQARGLDAPPIPRLALPHHQPAYCAA